MLYFLIALAASVIGAVSGLGGGIIIKPLMDALSPLNSSTISFLSTATVFAMSLTAAVKYVKAGIKLLERNTVILAVGAAIGGTGGTSILSMIIAYFGNDNLVKLAQNILLFLVLAGVVLYMRAKNTYRLSVTSNAVILLTGLILGAVSAFLGIGGGPINIAALTLLFSLDLRQAAVSSMVLILFSQGAKLISVFLAGGPPPTMDYGILLLMVPAGIVGGLIGSAINRKIDKKTLSTVYELVLVFVMVTCLINIYMAL